MSTLEDKIKNNRGGFDREVPEAGHMERFAQRLERSRRSRKILYRRYIMTIGSVAAILIMGLTLMFNLNTKQDDCTSPICEVKRYYYMQVLEEAEEIKDAYKNGNQLVNRELKRNINTIIEESDINRVQTENMTEEEEIAFIISYYNYKIESLRHIKSLIETI
ncbi:hypothetical protein LJC12_00560 [Odoribacter sp. OttesenSCG-928-J03]|nr:hypothetical protein [Odoribacter sp. OttesenSCG-928-J03]MDL2283364.1 hypothetical protein [Odoribacter sp. OttesenSCG-928-G04]